MSSTKNDLPVLRGPETDELLAWLRAEVKRLSAEFGSPGVTPRGGDGDWHRMRSGDWTFRWTWVSGGENRGLTVTLCGRHSLVEAYMSMKHVSWTTYEDNGMPTRADVTAVLNLVFGITGRTMEINLGGLVISVVTDPPRSSHSHLDGQELVIEATRRCTVVRVDLYRDSDLSECAFTLAVGKETGEGELVRVPLVLQVS